MKKITDIINNEKGIALVEVIAALGIAIIVITALVSLSIFTLRTSLQSKLLLEGTKIANREIELVRAYRDNDLAWNTFIDEIKACDFSSPCSMVLDGSGINYNSTVLGEGTSEEIRRQFTATSPLGNPLNETDDIARISVTVSWKIGGSVKQTSIYTDLSNWRNN